MHNIAFILPQNVLVLIAVEMCFTSPEMAQISKMQANTCQLDAACHRQHNAQQIMSMLGKF